MYMTAQARTLLDWKAAQGNKKAQLDYADLLEFEGKLDWAEFYRAKANGKNPTFTLAAFKAGK